MRDKKKRTYFWTEKSGFVTLKIVSAEIEIETIKGGREKTKTTSEAKK